MKKNKTDAVVKESKKENEKSATNNQWISNTAKYYPDKNKRM